MKKTGIRVLCIVLAVLLLGGGIYLGYRMIEKKKQEPSSPQTPSDPTAEFQIWPDQSVTTVKKGTRGEILVHLKNNSGKDYCYQGSYYSFHPVARLVSADGSFEIPFDELPMTMEFAHYTVPNGEVRDTTFSFRVPDDAAVGDYDLVLSFADTTSRYDQAVRVTE